MRFWFCYIWRISLNVSAIEKPFISNPADLLHCSVQSRTYNPRMYCYRKSTLVYNKMISKLQHTKYSAQLYTTDDCNSLSEPKQIQPLSQLLRQLQEVSLILF